ncbi:MAG: M24 family metallopeptidase, partial [Spirochaetaceae bacterium]|nr:M24 family metallopeptidase [Spirochaetaceae bacterium]
AEIAEIERAVATSVDMHKAALATARAGMRESDVAARVAQVAQAAGGDLSFPPIATTRPQILHDHRYAGILREGSLFLLDAGAETEGGYAGDLTTTFPIGPRFDERQLAIYDIVVAMRERASSMIRPGLPYREAHVAAARVAVAGLESLGLMRGDIDEAVAAGAHALFFPHGIGHALGLDVHDMESYGEDLVGYDGEPRSPQFGFRALRLAKSLAAGMTVTVEPGLYFIPDLIADWKAAGRHSAFIDYGAVEPWMAVGGVRSEEDWLVLPAGGRRLGPGLDSRAAAIEAARKR